MDTSSALSALEQLSSSPSTSASGPLNELIDTYITATKSRIASGEDPRAAIAQLQKQIAKAKKDVEKGLKGWYSALGGVGKAVDKSFPPTLATISSAYDDPPLFSQGDAPEALDRAVMDSLGRRGLWNVVAALEEETGIRYDEERRRLNEELHRISSDIEGGDVASALAWCEENADYIQLPPHPSPLPYHLHRSVFLSLQPPSAALAYARKHLLPYLPTQPVLQLLTSCLYPSTTPLKGDDTTMDVDTLNPPSKSPYTNDPVPLVSMFQAEYCRAHGLAKEEPLEVVVDLGSRGGALAAIEKARKVMGDRLGSVRSWQDLPMEIPLPLNRRYHSVFVCPVSKEQATDTNPPKMLTCGHVLATDSFNRLIKAGRRSAKCPYCPTETSAPAAQRLYF